MRNKIILAVFAALLAVAIAWVWRGGGGRTTPPGEAPALADGIGGLDFPPFALDSAAIVPTWESERAARQPLDDGAQAFLDAWHRNNFAVGVSERGLFQGDAAALRAALDRARRDWAALRTAEDYRILGWEAHERFTAGLDALLTLARTTHTRVEDLLNDPVEPAVHSHFEACGDFVSGALDAGIIGEYGELLVSPELVTLMFRYRWMWDAAELFPLEASLPGVELREMLRWRIEDAGLPLDARLQAIARLDREFDYQGYPVALARAVAYADAGRFDEARSELQTARESVTRGPDAATGTAAESNP